MANVNTQKRDVATPEAKLVVGDGDAIERWAKAERVRLETEAECAR